MDSKKFIQNIILLMTILLIPASVAGSPVIEGVLIYPEDHIWNVPVDQLPLDARSADYIANIGTDAYLHADFGSGLWNGFPIGIPYNVVDGSQQRKAVVFEYSSESDPGPYPIPENPLTEGGSDHHILLLDRDNGMLYELYAAEKQPDGSWHAGSGAIYNLSDYTLRPTGWTSADAAGLPILPGLVRYEEVESGEIAHAIRVTAPYTRMAYVWPARHYASSITNPAYPPMGQRFRLKSSFDTSGYSPQARVILNALKKYGMILADNGAPWYITGVPDERWDNDVLHTLHDLEGSDFEAVDTSSLMVDPDSGKAGRSAAIAIMGIFRPTASYNWILDYKADGAIDLRDHFGTPSDKPFLGDLNGDGIADRAVFRNGQWIIDYLMDGSADIRSNYGIMGDIPLIGDFDNDGITDRAVFRNGQWIIDYSMDGSVDIRSNYGTGGDIPLIGDFDNDGITDRAVFRNGQWIIDHSMDGSVNVRNYYGTTGDLPLIGDFNGDDSMDRAVFRSGEWIIDHAMDGSVDSRIRFGMSGDLPIVWNT